jgi:hypothetical protein
MLIASWAGLNARKTMAEEIEYYRGHRLEIRTFGPGWIVFIYPPGDMFACKEPPSTRESNQRSEVVTQAKALVDGFFPPSVACNALSFSGEREQTLATTRASEMKATFIEKAGGN